MAAPSGVISEHPINAGPATITDRERPTRSAAHAPILLCRRQPPYSRILILIVAEHPASSDGTAP